METGRLVAVKRRGRKYHNPDLDDRQREWVGCTAEFVGWEFGETWWTEPEADAVARGLKPCACMEGLLSGEYADAKSVMDL